MARKKTRRGSTYVKRPSQITKRAPTKRLKRRRAKNLKSPKRGFFPNPRPLLYIITAKASGKKMHYDGQKFSERARVKTFATFDAAETKATELIRKFPVLRRYRIFIESNFQKPRAA